MTTEHSPLPWSDDPGDGSLGTIIDANRDPVAQSQPVFGDTMRHAKRRANAAFICEAVNNYARLREALESIEALAMQHSTEWCEDIARKALAGGK